MDFIIEDINILNKIEELNIDIPDSLSFFPENLETAIEKSQFIFTESVVDLNKIFRQNNINTCILGGDTELYRSRKNADIYLPPIFISFLLFSENSIVISIVLNVLSTYISDFLKGSVGKKEAHIEFYIEFKKRKIKKISYKGTHEGIRNLSKVIKELK